MFYTYILQSKVDSSFNIGQTNDINDRVSRHNHGFVNSTKRKLPWDLVYLETFPSRKEAFNREQFIKAKKSRSYINSLINLFNSKA